MDPNNQTFNLTDVAEVLKRRRNFIILFVFLASIIAAILVFFIIPKKYRSTAVVVAANPVLADRAHLFNENIEGLYSRFGTEDDINRLLGIANLDTTYKLLVDKFNLVKYYEIKGDDAALNQRKAIAELREDMNLMKTELYQLKVSATTKDKLLSASLANYMVEVMQQMIQDLWRKSHETTLQKLVMSSNNLAQEYNSADSSETEWSQIKRQGILQQLQQNERIINQYKLAAANNTAALMVLEKAYPSAKADQPQKLLIIFGAFISALAFSIIGVLIFESRQ